MVGDQRTKPIGVRVDAQLWERFRDDVRDRRGRIRGVLGDEVERALRAYLEGSKGGDVTDELRRLREEVEGDDPDPEADVEREPTKNKKISTGGSPTPATADGGILVDDRDLDDDAGDSSAVLRRTQAAVDELLSKRDREFMIDDLDDAIERGADVHSKPSIRTYRDRVFEALGDGRENLVKLATEDRPIEGQVFYTDVRDARAERAAEAAFRENLTIEEAARELDTDVYRVRDVGDSAKLGAVLVRDEGLDVEKAADVAGAANADAVRQKVPDDLARDEVVEPVDAIEDDS